MRVKRYAYLTDSPMVEREVVVRQLVTPAVVDVVSGRPVRAGPELDDELSRRAYCKEHPDRTYAVAKRQLSKAELRRHGLSNDD